MKDAENTWILNIDGSSTKQSSGIGVILVTPDEHKIEYALKFKFLTTNNETEYKVLIARLHITR